MRSDGGLSGMRARGVNSFIEGDRSAVVINAINLPASSFPANGTPAGPNAAVRIGLGRNTLEWLTVRDARFAQANIDSGLQPLDPAPAVIRSGLTVRRRSFSRTC